MMENSRFLVLFLGRKGESRTKLSVQLIGSLLPPPEVTIANSASYLGLVYPGIHPTPHLNASPLQPDHGSSQTATRIHKPPATLLVPDLEARTSQ